MTKGRYGDDPAEERRRLEKNMNKVVGWVHKEHGVSVVFGAGFVNQFCPVKKEISINTRTNLRLQFHTLLHECGHVALRSNKKVFRQRFPDNRDGRYGKGYRIDVLREEFLAWEKGLEIAKQLRIPVDLFWYKKHLQGPLWSYIEWAKSPKSWII